MADLKLSQQLVDRVQQVIIDTDAEAQNSTVTLQYLSAIIGVLLGSQNISKSQKDEYLDQLNAFSKHVLDDVCSPPATPPPSSANAFGVWKP